MRLPATLVDNVKFIHSVRFNLQDHMFLNQSKAVMWFEDDGNLAIQHPGTGAIVYVMRHNVVTYGTYKNPNTKEVENETDNEAASTEDPARATAKKTTRKPSV